MTKEKFRVRVEIHRIREFEKRYVNDSNTVILGEEVDCRHPSKMCQAYFDTIQEADVFFKKLSELTWEKAKINQKEMK